MEQPNPTRPSPTRDVVDTASAAEHLTIWASALKDSGLVTTLRGRGPFTIFAPTDAAFKRLPPGALQALLKNTSKLKAILSYHVIANYVEAKHLKSGETMTLQGTAMTLVIDDVRGADLTVNGARVSASDVLATNGVIHAIDAVILPKNWKLMATAA